MDVRFLRVGARKRRKALGLTLIAAAEQIGCSKSLLSRWERMEIAVPSRYWLDVERVLGLTPAEVWRGQPTGNQWRGARR